MAALYVYPSKKGVAPVHVQGVTPSVGDILLHNGQYVFQPTLLQMFSTDMVQLLAKALKEMNEGLEISA